MELPKRESFPAGWHEPAITEEDLRAAQRIDTKMAAAYLGVPLQQARELAKAGKIGELLPGTFSKVYYQAEKLIAWKRGEPDVEGQAREVASLMLRTAEAVERLSEMTREMIDFGRIR